MTRPARLHLVDGTFELYRAHFSSRPDHAGPDGRDNKATVGIASAMLALLQDKDEAVTHLAVAFDNPIASFRNRLFDAYKSDEGVPPVLRAQFDAAEAACRALGITVWSMDEFEADDALASGAARFRDQVDQLRILTPDKDLAACLEGDRVVAVDRIRNKVKTQASAEADLGFPVRLVPDHLALVGDDADGIPGVPGIGQKTSSALLAAFGGLDAIPDDAALWPSHIRGAQKHAATLAGMRPQARLYRTLATLRLDAPVTTELEALRWRGVPRAAYDAWCASAGIQKTSPAVHLFAD